MYSEQTIKMKTKSIQPSMPNTQHWIYFCNAVWAKTSNRAGISVHTRTINFASRFTSVLGNTFLFIWPMITFEMQMLVCVTQPVDSHILSRWILYLSSLFNTIYPFAVNTLFNVEYISGCMCMCVQCSCVYRCGIFYYVNQKKKDNCIHNFDLLIVCNIQIRFCVRYTDTYVYNWGGV